MTPTEPARPVSDVWAVQDAQGGIPNVPSLFDNEDAALRCLVEAAVANDLEFTDDCSRGWIGNDDDEVRMWGPISIYSAPPDKPQTDYRGAEGGFVDRPLNEEERRKADAMLDAIRAQDAEAAKAGEDGP